jgi:hypothetical protein
MNSGDYRVRRANVEDRPWLIPLWNSVSLPSLDLDRRLTEFQVIETADGHPLGTLGFQISGRHGCIHSEAYADYGFADHFRPLLWERIESLAASHSLLCIWTQEQSPFWTRNGFRTATADARNDLPAAWRDSSGRWLMLQLREDVANAPALDKQIESLMEAERSQTERTLQRAKTLQTVATVLAIMLAIFVLVAAVYLMRKNPSMLGR